MKPKLFLCLALVLGGSYCQVHADKLTATQLEAEQRDLCALLARASFYSNSPAISPRDGDFSPYLTESEDERLTRLLRDPEASKIVTRDEVLAAIKQRQMDRSLPTFPYDALLDLVNQRWPHDPAVIAFYREALANRGDAAISDLWSPQPGIWDDSLLEPVVSLVERTTSWIVIDDALTVLDEHYAVWTNDTSIPSRLSKTVLKIFPSLTNVSVNPQLKGQVWCNAVRMLGESRDPAMVSVLRPYLKEKALADDPGGIGDGITTMRVCDDAATAINSLLNLKLEFPGPDMFLFGHEVFTNGTNVMIWKSHSASGNAVWSGFDPVWKEWDQKIAELQRRLDALANVRSASKVTLKFVSVDSEETNSENGYGANAVDGNPNTYWHTQWQGNSPALPHEIVIELLPPSVIKGFTYLPRQDESDHGTIKDYEFYVSNDGTNFGQPVIKGAFEAGKEEKLETFTPVKCRFIKLKALSEINGLPWTSAAEIGVIQSGENTDLMTNQINQANARFAEFERTKSIDQLERAFRAVERISPPGVDPAVPWSVARQEQAKMWLKLLATIDQNTDLNFDLNNPTNWPALNMGQWDYPPEVDPKIRAQYEAAVKQNKEKAARELFQTRLDRIDQLAGIDVERFFRTYYTSSQEDQNELQNLMKQAELSLDRVQKLKALFEAGKPFVDPHLTKQIYNILAECQKIKPGMTRAELLKIFTTEGGLSTAEHRTFVCRDCPYIKVDVDFTLSDPKQSALDERPTDTIQKISKPYLDWSIID